MVVLAGLPTVRFDFSVFYTAEFGQKNTPLVSQRDIEDDSILFSVYHLLKFARGSAGKTAYFQKNQSTAEAAQSFAAAIRQIL